MDTRPRREMLTVRPNPTTRLDYLVVLRDLPCGLNTTATLKYVPDRHLLDRTAFRNYLLSLGTIPWPGPEEQAVAVLDDVGNEVVPRWAQVTVTCDTSDGLRHQAAAQEFQPGWTGSVPDLT